MQEIIEKLEQQEKKLDDVYKIVHQIKMYFLANLIFTVIAFVLPFLGLLIAIPWFLKNMQQTYEGLL